MADLLDLSARIIDSGIADEPVNRITQQLSELDDGLAIVESFSHSVVLGTDDGLVAFDASSAPQGADVAAAIAGWSPAPLTHLVYTHGHVDHVGGSGAFAERWGAPTVVGHRNVARRFDRYREMNDWNVAINARQFGGIRSDRGLGLTDMDAELGSWRSFLPSRALAPDLVVDGEHLGAPTTIAVGGVTIELHHALGETDDHLWAWLPERRTVMAGDFLIWNFPNAGNPQKVQRYPRQWAAALRAMAERQPELIVPAHGLPIAGVDRIATVLTTVADTLEGLVDDVIAAMNAGATLDEVIHSVAVSDDILALPYLRPFYDEPEFVVRNVWRQYGGWWDGAASRLKPAPDGEVARAVAELTGGADRLIDAALARSEAGEHRVACHLADLAGWAAPADAGVHRARAVVYRARRAAEPSLMSKGIFAAAARESEAIADDDN